MEGQPPPSKAAGASHAKARPRNQCKSYGVFRQPSPTASTIKPTMPAPSGRIHFGISVPTSPNRQNNNNQMPNAMFAIMLNVDWRRDFATLFAQRPQSSASARQP